MEEIELVHTQIHNAEFRGSDHKVGTIFRLSQITNKNDLFVCRWSDGSPVSFINWDRGQPGRHWGNRDCVQMSTRTGKWSMERCSRRNSYLCQLDIGE